MQNKTESIIKAVVDKESSHVISDMAEPIYKTHEELAALKIIYPGMPQREVLNTFRDLRTRLLDRAQGKNFILLVSSLCEGGGSSFVAMNLAASFALDEHKTALYIDCNVDSPFSDELLKDSYDHGLMEYLESSEVDVEDIIYSTGVPRVRTIPPGKSHEMSVERFASAKMTRLIESVKKRYRDRFVVIDVPPVSESSVARILAGVADMAVVVVPFGKVTKNQVLAGIDSVGEEKFAGFVFNN